MIRGVEHAAEFQAAIAEKGKRQSVDQAPRAWRLKHAPLRKLTHDEFMEARHLGLIDDRMFEAEAKRRMRSHA